MNTTLIPRTNESRAALSSRLLGAILGVLALAALLAVVPARAETDSAAASTNAAKDSDIVLREGDTIKVTFPGAPDLNPDPAIEIRPDGKVTLPLVGEVQAAGRTPAQLQNDLLKLYAGQLQTKEVVVSVVSSSFSVFVDGAVLRSGKVVSNHPMTILEAVMEAGGFDYTKANTQKVLVIRKGSGSANYSYFTLNLKDVLSGKSTEAFYLQPGDMVHVPERFAWF